MSYIDSVMVDGETLAYKAHISPWYFLADFAVIGVLVLLSMSAAAAGQGNVATFLGVVALGFLGRVGILYYCTELAITNRRVIVKVGFISRYTVEINLNRVESIQVAQSVMGRILNYGTVMVNGTGAGNAPIKGIHAPIEFRKKYNEIQA